MLTSGQRVSVNEELKAHSILKLIVILVTVRNPFDYLILVSEREGKRETYTEKDRGRDRLSSTPRQGLFIVS